METSDPKYKHKPSEKHTLEEVLKSLQDLIRNDLADGAPDTAKPGTSPVTPPQPGDAAAGTAEASPRRDKPSGLREDFAPVAPGSGPVNLDAVMRSLKDLIGNELDVGDTPTPEDAPPAATHAEYLATEDQIEEYIPEELGRLDDVLDPGDASIPEPELAAPPPDEAPEEIIIEETLPQGFTPLDEELTLEELAETLPPPPEATENPELPGEISPELLVEPEVTPPPSAPETPPPMNDAIAPGTQQEMFLEEPPLIELRVPPRDTQFTPAPEPAPETSAPEEANAAAVEEAKDNPEQALPTIEAEESLETLEPPVENPPEALEEFIALDAEIPGAAESAPPADMTSAETTTEATPAPEAPAAPVEKIIALEIASEPAPDRAQDEPSIDFDTLGLDPSPSEPAPETELPVIAIEPDLTPASAPEAPEQPPATAIESGTLPAEESLAAPEDTKADAPESFDMEDIPVLNEVVAPPAGSLPSSPPAAAAPLPAPDRARDLVVRAVAKLNVEMRKTGGAGLDTKTILRLQQLIRQELEKDREQ